MSFGRRGFNSCKLRLADRLRSQRASVNEELGIRNEELGIEN
jgi:hypothetical protein